MSDFTLEEFEVSVTHGTNVSIEIEIPMQLARSLSRPELKKRLRIVWEEAVNYLFTDLWDTYRGA